MTHLPSPPLWEWQQALGFPPTLQPFSAPVRGRTQAVLPCWAAAQDNGPLVVSFLTEERMDGPSRLPSPPQVLLSTYVCFPPQDRVHSRKEQDLFIPSGSKQITWQTGNLMCWRKSTLISGERFINIFNVFCMYVWLCPINQINISEFLSWNTKLDSYHYINLTDTPKRQISFQSLKN